MKLITDSASCKVTLRNASLYIACSFLALLVLIVISEPILLRYKGSLTAIIIELVPNLALLFGALWRNQWLVLVWLIKAAIFFIGWTIGLLGMIFNFLGYRRWAFRHNIVVFSVAYLLVFVLFAYCARLVYSYFHQLRNKRTKPQQPVEV